MLAMPAAPTELDRDDHCPYVPLNFEACPAFEEIPFEPMTSLNERLQPGRSCKHLRVGIRGPGHYYGRCELGSRAERAALADSQRLRSVGGASGVSRKLDPAYVAGVLARSAELSRRTRATVLRAREIISGGRRPAA